VATAGSRCEEDGTGTFSARLRDEVLGSQTFTSLPEARTLTGNWRRHYNETRPQYSAVEDEPQASQVSDAAGSLEMESSVSQTLQPKAGSEGPPQPGAKGRRRVRPRTDGRRECPNGWSRRLGGGVCRNRFGGRAHDHGGAGTAGTSLWLAGGHRSVRQHGTGTAGGVCPGDQACPAGGISRWETSSPSALPPMAS